MPLKLLDVLGEILCNYMFLVLELTMDEALFGAVLPQFGTTYTRVTTILIMWYVINLHTLE